MAASGVTFVRDDDDVRSHVGEQLHDRAVVKVHDRAVVKAELNI
jgi:hypothetical protein